MSDFLERNKHITKEFCRDYAAKQIEVIDQGYKNHLAFKWLQMEPIERAMGGFANFRHYFCNLTWAKQIEERQKENNELEEKLIKIENFTCGRSAEEFRDWIQKIFNIENSYRASPFKSHLPDALLGIQGMVKLVVGERDSLKAELEKEIAELKSELEKEKKVVDFYASDKAWFNPVSYPESLKQAVVSSDLYDLRVGGKLARQRQRERK